MEYEQRHYTRFIYFIFSWQREIVKITDFFHSLIASLYLHKILALFFLHFHKMFGMPNFNLTGGLASYNDTKFAQCILLLSE